MFVATASVGNVVLYLLAVGSLSSQSEHRNLDRILIVPIDMGSKELMLLIGQVATDLILSLFGSTHPCNQPGSSMCPALAYK